MNRCRWNGCRLDSDGADLELWHPAYRVERRVGQAIDRLGAAPMEWDEDRIRAQIGGDLHFEPGVAATSCQVRRLAVRQSELTSRGGMDLHQWLRSECGKPRHAASERAGLVLPENASCRQVEWVVRIGYLGRRGVLDGPESRPAIRSREALGKEPWRTRMVGTRARPVRFPDWRRSFRSSSPHSRQGRPRWRGRARRISVVAQ
jgi:hypothetical protein